MCFAKLGITSFFFFFFFFNKWLDCGKCQLHSQVTIFFFFFFFFFKMNSVT